MSTTWLDRVQSHYRSIFAPPPVRVVSRKHGLPPEMVGKPLSRSADGQHYVRAILGAAMLDCAGVTDAVLSGLSMLIVDRLAKDARLCVYCALRATGRDVSWGGSLNDSVSDLSVMHSLSTSDILGNWQVSRATVCVGTRGDFGSMVHDVADRTWDVKAPNDHAVVAAAWQAVTGKVRHFDRLAVDALNVADFDGILRFGAGDLDSLRRLTAMLRDRQGDDKPANQSQSAVAADDTSDNVLAGLGDSDDTPDPISIGDAAKEVVHKLSQMPGFGAAARDWGMQLASDLRDYAAGAISWQDVDCGCLLIGPPGCGKTTFARAVALEAGCQFVATSYSDWEGQMTGTSYIVKSMKKMFDGWRKKASQSNPLIVFVDEIDSMGVRGGNGHNNGYWDAVINSVLDFADGAIPRDGVVLMGATNFIDRVDPALRRPGRFDRVIELAAPDIDTLRGIIHHHMGVDDIHAARACRGMSPADIAQACRDARRTARRSRRQVTSADLIAVIDSRRPARPASELHRIALHEAGHALACIHFGIPLQYVDVDRMHTLHGYQGFLSASAILDLIVMALAGRAAEDARTDNPSVGAVSDLAWATELARKYHTQFGYGASGLVSTDDAPWRFDSDVRKTLDDCYARARSILVDRRDDLTALVKALETRRYLDADEVKAAINYNPHAELLALVREDR